VKLPLLLTDGLPSRAVISALDLSHLALNAAMHDARHAATSLFAPLPSVTCAFEMSGAVFGMWEGLLSHMRQLMKTGRSGRERDAAARGGVGWGALSFAHSASEKIMMFIPSTYFDLLASDFGAVQCIHGVLSIVLVLCKGENRTNG